MKTINSCRTNKQEVSYEIDNNIPKQYWRDKASEKDRMLFKEQQNKGYQ